MFRDIIPIARMNAYVGVAPSFRIDGEAIIWN
jgi:hypothetical protein